MEDAFYKDIEFGTGGMRGVMGVGTNRINKYTLGKVTQGLALYLKSEYKKDKIKVVIAYDCRNNNISFSEEQLEEAVVRLILFYSELKIQDLINQIDLSKDTSLFPEVEELKKNMEYYQNTL